MHSFSAARQSIGYMETTGANLSKSLGRLSSGLKVKIDEDAGGLAVSSKMDSVISRSAAIAQNVQNGLSFLESQDSAQNRLGSIITRMSELRHRYDDLTLNVGDKHSLNREFKELKGEIKSIAQRKFNGISLFSNESETQSKLIVNTAADARSTLREISRNLFFNSILDTNSTAGPIGANLTVQGSRGSFAGTTVTPTGGTTPDQTISGAAGTTPTQTIKGVQGSTLNQTVNGGAPGKTPAQVVKATQGITGNQTVNGGAAGTTPDETVNAVGGSVSNQSIKSLPLTSLTEIGSGYDPTEAAPAVSIAGTNKGSLAGTATIRPDGKIDVAFTGAGVPSSKATANERWNTAGLTTEDANTKPTVDSAGNVYFVGSSGPGTTVNSVQADGTPRWSEALGATADCNPTLSDDGLTLFVGFQGGLRAIDTSNGLERWTYNCGAVNTSQPVLSADGQTVYFGSDDDNLHAVHTTGVNAGTVKWIFGTGSNVQSAPVVDSSGHIYFASTNRNVYKIQDDGTKGTEVWVNNFTFSGAGTFRTNDGASPALSNDESTLYLGDGNGNVAALNTTLGTDNWGGSAQVPGRIRGHFAVGANDNVYFTSTDRRVFAFRDNGATATQLGSFRVFFSNFTRQSPTVNALNQVFFTSNNGRVYALDGDNPGTWGNNVNLNGVQWRANMGDTSDSTPALDPSGNIVYVGDNQGRVFAYEDPIDITVAVASGTLQRPANLNDRGTGYDPTETAPVVKITGADAGTLTGTASITPAGKINVVFSGAPTGTGNLNVAIDDGLGARPANLTGIGTGYDPTETAPAVNITGADAGALTGTASITPTGEIDVVFSNNPTGNGTLTVSIASGVIRVPANLNPIGSGYKTSETPPVVSFPGANAGTLNGTATINTNGSLNVALTGSPDDTNDVTMNVATGVLGVNNLTDVGSGYSPGDPVPVVSFTGANAGTLAGTASITPTGTINVAFSGNPNDTNNVGVQITDGLARVGNLPGIGTGYDPAETPPIVTITGATMNTLKGTTAINANGTLDLTFTGNPSDFTDLDVQIASGTVQAPSNLTGLGGNHSAGSPPAITISGADRGTLSGTASVNSNGTVDVSFSGTPSGTGSLNVNVDGDTTNSVVSEKYLLALDGDLWDYSVAEFENFSQLISDARAQNGAEQNSLGTSWELLSTNLNQLEKANGRIKDADYAKEMTNLGKSQILNQSAAMTLGQQNRITSEALLTIQRLKNKL